MDEVVWRENISPYIEALPYTPRELWEKMKKSAVVSDAARYWVRLDEVVLDRESLARIGAGGRPSTECWDRSVFLKIQPLDN